MDWDEVEVHKLAKKRARPISSHLDQTNLVNKGFIIWLLVKFCSRDTAGSPERARWLHLARSGSQSQRAIWFVLPARKASHIITWSYNSYRLSSLGSYCTLSACGLLSTCHKVFFVIYFFILPSAFCSTTWMPYLVNIRSISGYVKGGPFLNKRCIKGVSFLPKWCIIG